MIHPDDWFILDELAESALNGGTHVAEFRIINREGDARWLRYFACAEWDEAGEHVVGILGAAQDVTERKHHEQQIEQLAYYDALSGLANRRLLHLRTAEALDIAQKRERPFAVLYLDLDRFKAVNDTLGHETGDDLLKQVAERLRTCVRTSDLLARLGGDEFAVLLTSADEKQAIAVAQRMLHQFDQAFVVRDHRLWVGGSIGIACYPRDGAQVGTLLKHADIAMYRAKGRGGQYQVYDETLNTYRHEQLRLEADLRQA
ncbi:MAG: sensor domain-containing diguanylate cyclase, partial [Chloroflexaceae bacterium]|nr:sensor domain-containing diguanylate cyclase [Chloroflexaceae bacterium]